MLNAKSEKKKKKILAQSWSHAQVTKKHTNFSSKEVPVRLDLPVAKGVINAPYNE